VFLLNKHIGKKDLVAAFGFFDYYYADFSHIDVNYIFSNVCDTKKVKLLSFYPFVV
jgi:hypothetical protein